MTNFIVSIQVQGVFSRFLLRPGPAFGVIFSVELDKEREEDCVDADVHHEGDLA